MFVLAFTVSMDYSLKYMWMMMMMIIWYTVRKTVLHIRRINIQNSRMECTSIYCKSEVIQRWSNIGISNIHHYINCRCTLLYWKDWNIWLNYQSLVFTYQEHSVDAIHLMITKDPMTKLHLFVAVIVSFYECVLLQSCAKQLLNILSNTFIYCTICVIIYI